MSQLYPRPDHTKDVTKRRWRVDYDLAYDGGGTHWEGYYQYKVLALVATWWNVHVSSWGGTAFLYDQEQKRG